MVWFGVCIRECLVLGAHTCMCVCLASGKIDTVYDAIEP